MANKICTVTTIKAPLNDTLAFVNYHLNIGIDHMYLFFDDPKDVAIKSLSNNKKVTCFKCDSKHWNNLRLQKDLMKKIPTIKNIKKNYKKGYFCLEERQQLNANVALKIARQNNCDWIIHIDSDELIYSKSSLKKNIIKSKKNAEVLRLSSLEAVPERLIYKNVLKEISLFKSFGAIARFYYSHKKMLQKIFPNLKKNEGKLKTIYFRGHAAGKSIISTNSNIKNVGMHEPVSKANYKLIYDFPKKILLLHFACRNFENWKKKWIKIYKQPTDAIGYKKENIPFFKNFVTAYKNQDINKMHNLYKKNYFIPKKRKIILMLLGLLKRIKLDKKLFEKGYHEIE